MPASSPPMVQPRIAPHVRRQTRPVGVESSGRASARAEPLGDEAPAEVARRDCSAMATPRAASPTTRREDGGPPQVVVEGARVLAPAEGREPREPRALHAAAGRRSACRSHCRCPQSRNVTTRIQTASEFAPRDVRMSWPATSPMPRNVDADRADGRRPPGSQPSTPRPTREEGERSSARRGAKFAMRPCDRGRHDGQSCGRRESRRPARRGPAPRPCACAARRGRCS